MPAQPHREQRKKHAGHPGERDAAAMNATQNGTPSLMISSVET